MTAPSPPAESRPHVDGLLSLLAANVPAAPAAPGQQLRVFDAESVKDVDGKIRTPPYVVLYPGPGWPDGTLGDRWRWLTLDFQVTAVGSTRRQAQWAADWARGVLLTQQPTVEGRLVYPLWPAEGSPPVTRDDNTSPALFYAPVLYQMRSAPAAPAPA